MSAVFVALHESGSGIKADMPIALMNVRIRG
jgi:hypothetical protein